jgi:uncharacterized membrane protein YkoI
MRKFLGWLGASAALALLMVTLSTYAGEEKIPLGKLPKAVVDALKAKFPSAQHKSAIKEIEDGKTKYEVTITHKGKILEVTVSPDGKILEEDEVGAVGEEKFPLDKLPKAVKDALLKRFPQADLKGAEQEKTEDGKTFYDVALKQKDNIYEVAVTPEGVITGYEKVIDAKAMPNAVSKALQEKYPKATYKLVEEVYTVKGDAEKLVYYEVALVTANNMRFEVHVAPDGKILKAIEEGKKKP